MSPLTGEQLKDAQPRRVERRSHLMVTRERQAKDIYISDEVVLSNLLMKVV
jgi:hypothetical protein